MPDEFDLIADYFAPLAGEAGLGLLDDAACYAAKPGYDLIISKDLLVEGVHFLETADPVDIAIKSVAVNISDLAAKGAVPDSYFLGLSLPRTTNDRWMRGFAYGLEMAQNQYDIKLSGGDTTSTGGPVTISVTALGYVPEGTMIKRSGAKNGDDIYVTGTLGDAAFGLKVLQGTLPRSDFLEARYWRPTARHRIGQGLVGLASAAADVSDGLLADVGHIAKASNIGALLYKDKLPLSPSVTTAIRANPELESLVWSGGDDYEIVFTAPKEARHELDNMKAQAPIPITRIGQIEQEAGVRLVDPDGKLVQIGSAGFQHF